MHFFSLRQETSSCWKIILQILSYLEADLKLLCFEYTGVGEIVCVHFFAKQKENFVGKKSHKTVAEL